MPGRITVNRKRQRTTNYTTDRRHVVTTQVIRGQIGLYGTTTAGCLFPMDQLYANDGTLATHINQNSFNDGSAVSMQSSFTEFDGFAHGITNPQDLASYRYSRGWVSSVSYKLLFNRPCNTMSAVRLTTNAGEFSHNDTSECKVGVVGLHPTQAKSLTPQGLTGFPNCRCPGAGPDQSFANFLRLPGARYKTIRTAQSGKTNVTFKRKYALKKFAIPGFPLASSGFWFKTVTRENSALDTPQLFILIYKPFIPQGLAAVPPPPEEPEAVTAPTIVDFTWKVSLKITLIEPFLPSNLWSTASYGYTGITDIGFNGTPQLWENEFYPNSIAGTGVTYGPTGGERPTLDDCSCQGPTGAQGPTGPTGPTGP